MFDTALLFVRCVIWRKLLHLSEPQFLYLLNVKNLPVVMLSGASARVRWLPCLFTSREFREDSTASCVGKCFAQWCCTVNTQKWRLLSSPPSFRHYRHCIRKQLAGLPAHQDSHWRMLRPEAAGKAQVCVRHQPAPGLGDPHPSASNAGLCPFRFWTSCWQLHCFSTTLPTSAASLIVSSRFPPFQQLLDWLL